MKREPIIEEINIERYLTCLTDTERIRDKVDFILKTYQNLRSEKFNNNVYNECNCICDYELEKDFVYLNQQRSGGAWHVSFPTSWLGDPNWLEKAKDQIELEFNERLIEKLRK